MKVMIDTNIFISAALYPDGKVSEALMKALSPPFRPITCDYVIDELHRVFYEKFSDRVTEMEAFLYAVSKTVAVVPVPSEIYHAEACIRDPQDRPILRAALSSSVNLFLTGDRDFLDSSIDDPRIISVAEFLSL